MSKSNFEYITGLLENTGTNPDGTKYTYLSGRSKDGERFYVFKNKPNPDKPTQPPYVLKRGLREDEQVKTDERTPGSFFGEPF